jgi:hypothetical protein
MNEYGNRRRQSEPDLELRLGVSGKHSQRTRVEYWLRERLHKAEEANTVAGCSIIKDGDCLDVCPVH